MKRTVERDEVAAGLKEIWIIKEDRTEVNHHRKNIVNDG